MRNSGEKDIKGIEINHYGSLIGDDYKVCHEEVAKRENCVNAFM
jgi:hypothetical protein